VGKEIKVEGASLLAKTFCVLHRAALHGSTQLRLVGIRELDLAPDLLRLLLARGSEGQLGLLFFFDLCGCRVQIFNVDGYLAVTILHGHARRKNTIYPRNSLFLASTTLLGILTEVAFILCLHHDLLEWGHFSIVFIRSAEDLTNLSERKTSSGSLLKQHS